MEKLGTSKVVTLYAQRTPNDKELEVFLTCVHTAAFGDWFGFIIIDTIIMHLLEITLVFPHC